MSGYQKKSDDALTMLETLENAVAKNASGYDDLRKRADDLYEDRIALVVVSAGVRRGDQVRR